MSIFEKKLKNRLAPRHQKLQIWRKK